MKKTLTEQHTDHGLRNVQLYTGYCVAHNALFWMPVFFLFFSQRVSLPEVLLLEAVYYTAVVLLEVPSGYLSDRLGRRPTLLFSSLALVLAYTLFTLGDTFLVLALAQSLLAAGIAFNSGTDTSFHLDSLTLSGRAHEYGPREANISRWSLWSTAGAAVVGGAAGLYDIRVAYLLSATAALIALAIAWRFVDPGTHLNARAGLATPRLGVFPQLAACVERAATAPLRWLFAFAVLATSINHIPYEFYQPYLSLLTSGQQTTALSSATPLIAGCHMGLSYLFAGWVGGHSVALASRFGTRRALMLSLGGQLALIASMGLWLSPLVGLLLMLRSVPGALQRAPLNQEVAPRLPGHLRATYLSLQSLAGRLGFAATLVGMSLLTSDSASATWEVLSSLISVILVCFGLLWGALALWHEPLAEHTDDTNSRNL